MTTTYLNPDILLSDIELIDDVAASNYTITFKSNCCGEGTVFDLRNSVLALSGTEIVIPPSALGLASFIDGVYSFEIKLEYPNGTCKKEKGCLFISEEIFCDVIAKIAEGDYEAHRIYEGIIGATNCMSNTCTCKEACDMFNLLLDKLGKKQIDNDSNTEDCGCN